MATRLNGRDGFGTFQRGRIHVSIDIFNLNSFLFRRWETIIVFLPSRGLLWRSPNNLDGVDVNPFASSYLVGRLKWVDSLVGSNPSSSFMFITPCTDSANTVLYRVQNSK